MRGLFHYKNKPIQIYWKCYHPPQKKRRKVLDKNSDTFFHISTQNIDYGHSLEPPRWKDSNEYPQFMFLCRNKKHNVYPVKPSFPISKWGLRRSTLYRHVFVMWYVTFVLSFLFFLTSSSSFASRRIQILIVLLLSIFTYVFVPCSQLSFLNLLNHDLLGLFLLSIFLCLLLLQDRNHFREAGYTCYCSPHFKKQKKYDLLGPVVQRIFSL